jgi:hypothetical protein
VKTPGPSRTLQTLLPVLYKSNPKAWVTQAISQDLFFHHSVHKPKKYCKENNLSYKIVLLVDNAPAILCDYHKNIKVLYLPQSTSLIQPTNQGVTQIIKKKLPTNDIQHGSEGY